MSQKLAILSLALPVVADRDLSSLLFLKCDETDVWSGELIIVLPDRCVDLPLCLVNLLELLLSDKPAALLEQVNHFTIVATKGQIRDEHLVNEARRCETFAAKSR